jgi:hypothetical protein
LQNRGVRLEIPWLRFDEVTEFSQEPFILKRMSIVLGSAV